VLLVGIALRSWQWLENYPLWIDELALANGLLRGSFAGLFDGPSDFAQIAPPGFLALEWLVSRAFPASDIALRLPSFVFSCAAIAATWSAARELVGERNAWVAAGLVALAGPLIFMGSQTKPYAADVFFSALILACALRHDRIASPGTMAWLLAAGLIAPLFSFGSVFVLAGAGSYLLLRAPRRGSALWPVLLTLASWATFALATLLLSRRLLSPRSAALMTQYWNEGFPTAEPFSLGALDWIAEKILGLLWSEMGLRGVWAFGAALVIGAVLAWRRGPALVALLLVPVVTAVVAATFYQYPFGHRVAHWAIPIFAILLAIVAAFIAHWSGRQARWLSVLPGLATLSTPLWALATNPPPYARDDVRTHMARLSAEGQPGDLLYVYWGAWHAWQRYGTRLATTLGRVHEGGCPVDYPRGYLREFDRFRGQRRLWVLFVRVRSAEEHGVLTGYLDSIGTRNASLEVAVRGVDHTARADLYLYDLSDTARHTLADAESFPIPDAIVRREVGCPSLDAMMHRADDTRVVQFF